jgi:voltage-gated potassium channel
MPAFLILLFRFFRSLWHGLKDKDFRALFLWVVLFLVMGTWFYAKVEGWTGLDALYFSVITLTTIGYGDLYPHTPAGKIFTIFYVLVGLGLISGFIFLLAERSGILKNSNPDKEMKNKPRRPPKLIGKAD